MSKLEKIIIRGIRSYDCSNDTEIVLNNELNLIHGANGSGKTTILECLRYVCTGLLPIGGQQANFVSDLKFTNVKVVKAKIELHFITKTGDRAVASRSLTLEMKDGKAETKPSRTIIELMLPNGKKETVSTRSLDHVKEMAKLIGVSTSILNHVILCHHDEAYWPLSEGKTVKDRFDQIFDTTLYNNALESLRLIRKEKSDLMKTCENELISLKNMSDKAAELKTHYLELQSTIENKKNNMSSINQQKSDIKNKCQVLQETVKELDVLQKQIDNLNAVNKHLTLQYDQRFKSLPELDIKYRSNLSTYSNKMHKRINKKEIIKQQIMDNINNYSNCIDKLKEHSNTIQVQVEINNNLQKTVFENYTKLCNILNKQNLIPTDSSSHLDISVLENYFIDHDNIQKSTYNTKCEEAQLLHENVDKCKNKKQNFTLQCDISINEVKAKMMQINKCKQEIKEIDVKIIDINNNLAESRSIQENIVENEQKLNLLGQKDLDGYKNQAKSLHNQLHDCEAKKEQLESFHGSLEKELTRAKEYENDIKKRDEIYSKRHNIFQSNVDIFQLFNIENLDDNVDSVVSIIQTQIKTNEDEIKSLSCTITRLKTNNENLNEKSCNIKTKIEQLDIFINKHQIQESNVYIDIKPLEESIVKLSNKSIKHNVLANVSSTAVSDIIETGYCPVCRTDISTNTTILQELEEKSSHHKRQHLQLKESLEQNKQLYNKISSMTDILDKVKQSIEEKQVAFEEINSLNNQIEHNSNEIVLNIKERNKKETLLKKLNTTLLELSYLQNQLKDLDTLNDKIIDTPQLKPSCDVEHDIMGNSENIQQQKSLCAEILLQINKLNAEIESILNEKTTINDTLNKLYRLKMQIQNSSSILDEIIWQKNKNEVMIQTLQCDINTENDAIKQHTESISQIDVELSVLELQINKSIHELDKLKIENHSSCTQITYLISDIKKRSSIDITGSISTLIEENNTIKQKIKETNELILQEKAKCQHLIVKIEKIKQTYSLIQSYIELESITVQIDQNNNKILEINSNVLQITSGVDVHREFEEFKNTIIELTSKYHELQGSLVVIEHQLFRCDDELKSSLYANAREKYIKKMTQHKILSYCVSDLNQYYSALDQTITRYHSSKMIQINKMISTLWHDAYKGEDIDTIEIRSETEFEANNYSARRSFNYRVVMLKNGVELDMRARCSSGQKTMASIIIRVALCRVFSNSCRFIALDEPTSNLDTENIKGLVKSMQKVFSKVKNNDHLQIIMISHDDMFLREICHLQNCKQYLKVYKDSNGYSSVEKCSAASLCD